MFLSAIHSFRAVAILFIIAGHVIWAFDWQQHPSQRDFLADFFENGTVLFVFVAGFLFQYLSSRFQFGRYLDKKFRNVVLPYLIMSTPAVLYTLLRQDPQAHFAQLQGTSMLYQAIWLYCKGGAHINYPLWFIPMISLYYLLAPLFLLLIRYPRSYWLLLVLIPVSLLIHRAPSPNLDLLHLSIYYLSAYVLGMCCSQYRHVIEPWILRQVWPLTGLFAAIFLLHFFLARHHGNYEVEFMFSQELGLIDWLYLQKLVLCFALWSLMLRFDAALSGRLRLIADVSFTLFFVHVYFVFGIQLLLHWTVMHGDLFKWAMEYLLVFGASLVFALGARKLLGGRSRWVVGS